MGTKQIGGQFDHPVDEEAEPQVHERPPIDQLVMACTRRKPRQKTEIKAIAEYDCG